MRLPLILFLSWNCASSASLADTPRDEVAGEIVITAERQERERLKVAGSVSRIDRDLIDAIAPRHFAELIERVPGAWIVRGSGQEHQTAIRSPVLGGGGACGGFLLLEDGIPVRPAGFCNINQFIELAPELAQAVEVVRGPGSALYGSNALHGTVNALMPMPGARPYFAVEAGADSFYRARGLWDGGEVAPWLAAFVLADDGGWRDDSGYRQGKLHLKGEGGWLGGQALWAFTATDLDQDTAGFIGGFDAYRDEALARTNPDAGAFRDADSQRLYAIWNGAAGGFTVDVRPYLRRSDMRFMHFALPGRPVEHNGQVSAGVLSAATWLADDWYAVFGVDLEWSDSFLEQRQDEPAPGPPRQSAIRPQGLHYDYDVRATTVAAYAQYEFRPRPRLALGAGLRLEHTRYDYDNHLPDGNTRDDGTPCGFGGCFYTRPADRRDEFTDLAPKLSVEYLLAPDRVAYLSLARGFRVPQALELYRLQSGQQVADLDTETLDSLELGLRTVRADWQADLALYAMRKRDGAFRDDEGFNVSGARSRHEGVEASVDWQAGPMLALSVAAAYARHRYDFSFAGRGQAIVEGNDIDSAPRWLASAEARWSPLRRWRFDAALSYVGHYFLDPGNRFDYPGHLLLDLRAFWEVTPEWRAAVRLDNALDERYADRADFAMGDYRYLPGRGRALFVELRHADF